MTKGNTRFGFVFCACLVFLLVLATSGQCQAWISPKGTGSFAVSYINESYNTDYFGHGEHYILIPPNPLTPNGYKLENFGKLRTQGCISILGTALPISWR